MNERIRKLAEQAFNEYESVYKSDANIPKEFTEKFAELIVRECATIAYQWQDEYGIIDDYYTPPPIDDVIKQQFGVLE